MSQFFSIIINIFFGLLFLFILWRRLREDYHFEKIFSLGFVILSFLGLFLLIGKYTITQYWFWFGFFGSLIGLFTATIRLKIRIFEAFEAVFLGLLVWIGGYYFNDSVVNTSLFSFLAFWITAIFIAIFYFLEANYKRFTWYKSGKVGFSGLVSLGFLFLTRGVFFKGLDSIISYVIAFFSFVLLYNLSRMR